MMASSGKRVKLAARVAVQLRERVLPGLSPGGQLPALRQLAAELGASVPTVRHAQALLAERGEIEVRHGSGAYRPTAAPRPWIGVVSELDLLAPRTSAYFTLTARYLRRLLAEQGFRAEMYLGESQPGEHRQQPSCPRLLENVAAGRLTGLVLLDAPETQPWVDFMRSLTIPAVGALTPHVVGPASGQFVEMGVEELHRQGCRRLAVLTWGDRPPTSFYEAVAVRGLETRRDWVRYDLHPQHTGAGWEEFREIWCAHDEKPDGLLVCDDLLMDDASKAIVELGIPVPEQLRIVAHSNRGSGIRIPLPVTRIVQDPEEGARRRVEILLDLLAGRQPAPDCGRMSLTIQQVEPHRMVEETVWPPAADRDSEPLFGGAFLGAGRAWGESSDGSDGSDGLVPLPSRRPVAVAREAQP